MNITKQERLTASKVDIRQLTWSQCDILSRLVLFAVKPLRAEEYCLLIGLIAPNTEPTKVWMELKNALMEQSWLEYDDVKEKATCHYYIAEAVRNQLLQAYFYRNTEKKYTLPNTQVRTDSSKPRQYYARLKDFFHLLLKQIGFAKELLSSKQFTQAGRFTFVSTFIEAFQQIMPLSAVPSFINEASFHEVLESLLNAVYKEQLDCALMIHDFPTIHRVIEQRFMQDSSCRFKQACALIKMGYLTINKEKIDDLIYQKQPSWEKEPLLFLERLVVVGIRCWYESNIPALQSVLETMKILVNQKPILSEKDQLLWNLLQS
jgi:hypothetical protein